MSTGSRGDGWVFQAYVLSRMRSDTLGQIVHLSRRSRDTQNDCYVLCARRPARVVAEMFGLSIAHHDENHVIDRKSVV